MSPSLREFLLSKPNINSYHFTLFTYFHANWNLQGLCWESKLSRVFCYFRAYLKDAEEGSSAELHRLTQTLLAYESVGMGFDSLVQQYTTLMAEIDNKKWALSELRQTQDDDLSDLWNQRW